MVNNPDELTLLEQHLFTQNQRMIEMSGSLDRFLRKGKSVVHFHEKLSAERIAAFRWLIVGGFIFAGIFFGTGYLLCMSIDALSLSASSEKVKDANNRAEAAESKLARVSADAAKATAASVEALAKTYNAEIDRIRAASVWAGSPQGLLAKSFFDLGHAEEVATCSSTKFEIVNVNSKKWCVYKKWNFLWGDDSRYGWVIP